jgi:hypothetical protein
VTGREPDDEEELVLSELLHHVLDKGVVIAGDVTISIAGIDLVRLGLTLALSSVESEERHRLARGGAPPLAAPDGA